MENEKLVAAAFEAQKNAYCKYSNFYVGAAVLTVDGEIFKGCNVENASYGATICAERNAIFAAVANGAALKNQKFIEKIAVTAMPCGMCLQVLAEFATDNMEILVCENSKSEIQSEIKIYNLAELLPQAFKL